MEGKNKSSCVPLVWDKNGDEEEVEEQNRIPSSGQAETIASKNARPTSESKYVPGVD